MTATLEQKLQASSNAVAMARHSQSGAYSNPHVPFEYTNWRDEQKAWRETAVLLDLTHHMVDLTLQGPDIFRLLSDLGVNSFKGVTPGRGKQFVCCNPDGYLIGDGVLFYFEENKISLLGLPAAHNWVQFHAESGQYNVTVHRDEITSLNPSGRRKLYRYQVQGPKALQVLQKASSKPLPEIKFFHIGEFTIAGKQLRALRHGMVGAPGLEVFGPWEDRQEVRAAIIEAGAQFGLRQVGGIAYPTTALESGWIPGPLPAIFTGEPLKAYREWLPANGHEGTSSLGGSFDSNEITDYYLTPYELGYGPFIKFDHEFIGRQALEKMGPTPKRRKVTLAWNADDVTAAIGTLFQKGEAARHLYLPWSGYAIWHYDQVMKGDRNVGLSTRPGYSYNERSMLSLALIAADVEIGEEVTLVWGEPNGEPNRPTVERHREVEIRAVVSPCPYSEVARTTYAPGWRTKSALRE